MDEIQTIDNQFVMYGQVIGAKSLDLTLGDIRIERKPTDNDGLLLLGLGTRIWIDGIEQDSISRFVLTIDAREPIKAEITRLIRTTSAKTELA
jgi:glycyl-tRNA synthetase alpha subunit